MPGCSNADRLPTHVRQKATGRMTAERSCQLVGTGGMEGFVELTNNTIFATPLTVRFYTETPAGQVDPCSSTFAMPPLLGSRIYVKHAVFGANVTHRVDVSLASDRDAADVICTLYC